MYTIMDPLTKAVDYNLFWKAQRCVFLVMAVGVLLYVLRQLGNRGMWSLLNMGSASLLVALDEIRLLDIGAKVLIWRQFLYGVVVVSCWVTMRRGNIKTNKELDR